MTLKHFSIFFLSETFFLTIKRNEFKRVQFKTRGFFGKKELGILVIIFAFYIAKTVNSKNKLFFLQILPLFTRGTA